MPEHFRLFWVKESGCHAGTPVGVEQLEPAIRERVLALAGADEDIAIWLPFFDRREWRRRSEILSALPLERRGDTISCVLAPATAVRDRAATLALSDPIWASAPDAADLSYFPVWQAVSLALQRGLRCWIAEEYFCNAARFEDREEAFPMLVYQSARLCYGRPRTEFTYDLRDYPDCPVTLAAARKMIGRRLQRRMAEIEQRLYAAGMPALARRYSPVWHQDVLVATKNKPKKLVALLAAESVLINAVIDLGTERSASGVNRFARAANQALRNVHGMDLRKLGVRVLEEATRVLGAAR